MSMKPYPDLTPEEEKLLKYLKDGLSIKEIAAKKGVRENSIQQTKTRLLKKRNVSSSIELLAVEYKKEIEKYKKDIEQLKQAYFYSLNKLKQEIQLLKEE